MVNPDNLPHFKPSHILCQYDFSCHIYLLIYFPYFWLDRSLYAGRLYSTTTVTTVVLICIVVLGLPWKSGYIQSVSLLNQTSGFSCTVCQWPRSISEGTDLHRVVRSFPIMDQRHLEAQQDDTAFLIWPNEIVNNWESWVTIAHIPWRYGTEFIEKH